MDGVVSAANVVSCDLIPEVGDREDSGMPWCARYIKNAMCKHKTLSECLVGVI